MESALKYFWQSLCLPFNKSVTSTENNEAEIYHLRSRKQYLHPTQGIVGKSDFASAIHFFEDEFS